MQRRALVTITALWLAWIIIIIGYMHIAQMRYTPSRPDEALVWSANETQRRSLSDKPYLLDPFLNPLAAWDSEFYLSVATVGYDDPAVRLVEKDGTSFRMSYAFFPGYPYLMRLVRAPFTLLEMTPIAASAAAGLIISLLGTLAGLIALYDLVREDLGEDGGIRTAFLMLIFPTSFFFASIYTEGLFVGLAFGSLALMRRRQWVAAAVLAALATWTRSVGGVLLLPLLLSWGWAFRGAPVKRPLLIQLPLLFLPVAAYALWRFANGVPFDFVQANWFGGEFFALERTREAWMQFLERARTVPEAGVFTALTLAALGLALLSCLLCARRYPQLALFGLLALIVPLTAGGTGAQSGIRYVLAVPTLWVLLGRWSRSQTFERLWTVLSVLLLAMMAFLFSYDFWAG